MACSSYGGYNDEMRDILNATGFVKIMAPSKVHFSYLCPVPDVSATSFKWYMVESSGIWLGLTFFSYLYLGETPAAKFVRLVTAKTWSIDLTGPFKLGGLGALVNKTISSKAGFIFIQNGETQCSIYLHFSCVPRSIRSASTGSIGAKSPTGDWTNPPKLPRPSV